MKKFMESVAFENWAPRSSRTWRLGKGSAPRQDEKSVAEQSMRDEDFVNSLNARISTMGSVRESMDPEPSALDSFEDASDHDLARGFTSRLEEVAATALGPQEHLTGQILRDLVYAKYGKTYDLSIVRRQQFGVNIVALNVMWTHLDQRSFPMSEPEFMDKLDTIAEYLRAWKQEDTVRKSLLEAPKSKRGLPSRPVTGNAVSIRLDLPQSVITEFFGR